MPTDPVAAPLLPETPLSNAAWDRLYFTHTSAKAHNVTTAWRTLALQLREEMRELETSRAPLPPRADWALEAAREICESFYALNGLTTEEQILVILDKHAPAAPDAQDGERLDWSEKASIHSITNFMEGGEVVWCVQMEDGQDFEGPTLRAALDQARG